MQRSDVVAALHISIQSDTTATVDGIDEDQFTGDVRCFVCWRKLPGLRNVVLNLLTVLPEQRHDSGEHQKNR